MFKNQAGQFVDVVLILRADGNDATGLTPTVRIKKDGGAWAASAGTLTEGENGSYEYEPTQAETNCDHLVIKFTDATAITALVNLYPVDVTQYQANVSGLSTFDHTSDLVTTDAASRTASQADVSNLDVAVSTRMPTTHIDATLGKVDGVALVDTATDVTNAVTTDTASRDASKADVSGLAVQTELDKVIKSGETTQYVQGTVTSNTNVQVTKTRV